MTTRDELLRYRLAHPDLSDAACAAHFGITRSGFAGSVSKARKAANHVNHADGMVAAFGSEEYRQQAIVSVEQAA